MNTIYREGQGNIMGPQSPADNSAEALSRKAETMDGYVRKTEAVKLRLSPQDAVRLREQARFKGYPTTSGFVVALLDARGPSVIVAREPGGDLGDLAILANSIAGLTTGIKQARTDLAQVGRLLKAQFVEAQKSAIDMRAELNTAIAKVSEATNEVEMAGAKCLSGLEPLSAAIESAIQRLANVNRK